MNRRRLPARIRAVSTPSRAFALTSRGWWLGLAVACIGIGCNPDANAPNGKNASNAVGLQGDGNSPPSDAKGSLSADKNDDPGSPSARGANDSPVSGRPASEATAIVEGCLGRYRSMKRYVDEGQLTVAVAGAPPFTTPFRVAWERPNRLAIAAHNVRGHWTSTTWEAVCQGPANPYPHQRLVRPLPDRIDLDWLMSDNLGGLFAPPVGLPIQLELLLAKETPQGFSGEGTKLSFLASGEIDGFACDRIQVERQGLVWVLWIDPKKQLLRKMELPPQLFYPSAGPQEQARIRCEIEMRNAKDDESIDWSSWSVPKDPADVSVRRLVLPPPIASTRILGTVLEPFDLKDSDEKLLFDAAEPKRTWTVLCWVRDDAAGEAFVKDLMDMRRVLTEQELHGDCQLFLVGDPFDTGLPAALKRWSCDIPLAIDRAKISESIFQMTNVPSLVILDRSRRVQVAENVMTSAAVGSIPYLITKLKNREDLASRQLQQDADNQARFIGALHRVAIDKEESAKLDPIREFQFSLHGMRRDWRIPFESPLLSAAGVWSPEMADGTGTADSDTAKLFTGVGDSVVMVALDDQGKLWGVSEQGTPKHVATIETEQADGAKRIHTAVDPWSRQWVSIVPEGLPRFWIAPLNPAGAAQSATTYNTQSAESPIASAWTGAASDSKLTILTTSGRLLAIDPRTEQRLDAMIGEDTIAMVPGLDGKGRVSEWQSLSSRGRLSHVRNLIPLVPAASDEPLEARLETLASDPEPGAWLWGRHGSTPTALLLAKLPSGETGVVACNHLYQKLIDRPLTVRPEQTRLLATSRLSDGTLLGLASGPNRILHLFTGDLRIMDQASFGQRIVSATIFPVGGDLKLLVALENEVSCWSIDVPDPRPASPRN
ncbi:MAG: hypothetical protein ACK5OB_03955 [Pirellula sp.]